MSQGKSAAERFAAHVADPERPIKLDVACALLAAAFTGVDRTDDVRATLDALSGEVVEPTLGAVLDVTRARFRGNESDYYDPRNSFIDSVLERGIGLPITLSVIAMEIGRRAGSAIVGIGLPAHFMIRDASDELYGDPFNGSALYDRTGVIAAWERLVGPGQPFSDQHLSPVTERQILIRMLNNLRAVFAARATPSTMYALAVTRGAFVELADEAPQHARWMRHWN